MSILVKEKKEKEYIQYCRQKSCRIVVSYCRDCRRFCVSFKILGGLYTHSSLSGNKTRYHGARTFNKIRFPND